MIRFDLDRVARRAASLVTPVLVTNGDRYEIVRRVVGRAVAQGEVLMELRSIASGGAAAIRTEAATREPRGCAYRFRTVSMRGPPGSSVRKLRDFDARVDVLAHGRRASAASAVSLMSLGVRRGDEIALEASGPDARAALEALAALIGGAAESHAPEQPSPSAAEMSVPVTPPVRGATLPGAVAVRGLALGTAAFVTRHSRSVAEKGAGLAREAAELARARETVRVRLTSLATAEPGPRAQILAAHLEFLDDPTLLAAAAAVIERGGSAGHAWQSAIRASTEALRDLGDARLLERADDLADLESQVLAALAGEAAGPAIELPERAIVIADELLPSQLVALEPTRIAGIATARGGPTSHVAILASAMGKPMLVGLGVSVLAIEPGTRLLLDADGGGLTVDPLREDARRCGARARRAPSARFG